MASVPRVAASGRERFSAVALPFWAWCVIALFSIALYTASVPLMTAVYDVTLAVAFTIATVQCGSLILAVFRPRVGTVVHLLSIVVLVLVTRDSTGQIWPLPINGLVSLGALILLVGIRERWVISVTTWWLSIVVLVALVVLSPQRVHNSDQWGTNLTIYATYTATVLIAAIALGQRRRIRADLAAARRDVELEQAQRRYVEERARIARELHDVVAHSMSLIHMQAISAPFRLTSATQATVNEEFEGIARSARTALAEMRQLLGALTSTDDAQLFPQPQLRDVQELTAATSRAGIPIEVTLDVDANEASTIAQLIAFRIVQEALSNVVRHAPTAATTVTIAVDGRSLHVRVENAAPTEYPDAIHVAEPDRGGLGLRGMRERVNIVGGQLTTGPTTVGGYLVDATFPAVIA